MADVIIRQAVPEDTALARLELVYPLAPPPVRAAPGAGGAKKPPPPGATLRLQGVTSRPRDVEDLVAAAFNAAVRKAEEVSAAKMSALVPAAMQGMGMPGGMKFPF